MTRLLLASSLFACVLLAPAPILGKPASFAQRAPSFALPARQGTVSLDSLRGRVVYVDFWASWCGPCRQSFRWMADMKQRLPADKFAIVAVDLDKDRSKADAFLREQPTPFTIAFDPEGRVAEAYHVSAMPTSFLIDPKGAILFQHSGFDAKRTAAVEARIQEALTP